MATLIYLGDQPVGFPGEDEPIVRKGDRFDVDDDVAAQMVATRPELYRIVPPKPQPATTHHHRYRVGGQCSCGTTRS